MRKLFVQIFILEDDDHDDEGDDGNVRDVELSSPSAQHFEVINFPKHNNKVTNSNKVEKEYKKGN